MNQLLQKVMVKSKESHNVYPNNPSRTEKWGGCCISLCSTCYTALEMSNNVRNFFAISPGQFRKLHDATTIGWVAIIVTTIIEPHHKYRIPLWGVDILWDVWLQWDRKCSTFLVTTTAVQLHTTSGIVLIPIFNATLYIGGDTCILYFIHDMIFVIRHGLIMLWKKKFYAYMWFVRTLVLDVSGGDYSKTFWWVIVDFVLIVMLTTTGSTLVKLSVHHSGV